MPAITIRNLSDSVHAALKQQATAEKLSVEALVRRVLAAEALTVKDAAYKEPASMPGFSKASLPRIQGPPAPAAPMPDLWGALRGTVHIRPGTDLAASVGDPWEAAN